MSVMAVRTMPARARIARSMFRDGCVAACMSRPSRLARHRAERGLGHALDPLFVLLATVGIGVAANQRSDRLRNVGVGAAKHAAGHRDHAVFDYAVMPRVCRFDEKL